MALSPKSYFSAVLSALLPPPALPLPLAPAFSAFLPCPLLCSFPLLPVCSFCPSCSFCVCFPIAMLPDYQGASVLFSPLVAHCKQWTAKMMDSTWKAYSSFGTVHNCNSSITNLLPSAVLTLTKSASAQLTHNISTCHPQPHLPINTPPHSQLPIHNTLTATTKHPPHTDRTTKHRAGNGQVNPNLPHTVCHMHHAP